jgi:hypothetical protein
MLTHGVTFKREKLSLLYSVRAGVKNIVFGTKHILYRVLWHLVCTVPVPVTFLWLVFLFTILTYLFSGPSFATTTQWSTRPMRTSIAALVTRCSEVYTLEGSGCTGEHVQVVSTHWPNFLSFCSWLFLLPVVCYYRLNWGTCWGRGLYIGPKTIPPPSWRWCYFSLL